MRMDKLTSRFQQALADAQSLAVGRDNTRLEPAHLLAALLDQQGGSTVPLLAQSGVNVPSLRTRIGQALDKLPKVAGQEGNINVSNDLTRLLNLTDRTSTFSVSAGLQGSLFDKYDWEAYYTHGEGRVQQVTHDNVNTEKVYASSDAVTDRRTGNTVCRVSLTAPGAYPDCVPMDILDNGAP